MNDNKNVGKKSLIGTIISDPKWWVIIGIATVVLVWTGWIINLVHFLVSISFELVHNAPWLAKYGLPVALAVVILMPGEILAYWDRKKGLTPSRMKRFVRFIVVNIIRVLAICIAAVSVHNLELTPLTYALWALGWIGGGLGILWLRGFVNRKFSKSLWVNAPRVIVMAVVLGLALPFAFLLTKRTVEFTVQSVDVDTESHAFNVTTDLGLMDHWKVVACPWTSATGHGLAPGEIGLTLLNRDVPLAGHRRADSFNAAFKQLTGKRVKAETVGVWFKGFHLRPTIIHFEPIATTTAAVKTPETATNSVPPTH